MLIRLRKRAVSAARFATTRERGRGRASVKASNERLKYNKNYEESRGSPPGYESRATE